MEKIKISIVTITYNSEKTLEETINSIKAQNYENLEYIIVDGGSSDKTLEIIKEHNGIVTKFISEPDEGISDAFNKGIGMAEGDVIGIINSDDMLFDGALDKIAEMYDEQTDVYYGNIMVCDEDGKHLHVLKSSEDLSGMDYNFCMAHPAVFVSKKAYDKHGVFRKELKCAMDYDLLLRLYKAGAKFMYTDNTLAVYRTGGVNMKMRKRTIKEVRDISIYHGGSKLKASLIALKKKLRDKLSFIKIKNKRVVKYENFTDAETRRILQHQQKNIR